MPASARELRLGQARSDFLKAPSFQPSLEQFKNPVAYLAGVREPAEGFGLCAIFLPSGWTPTVVQPQEGLGCFLPAAQALHLLQDLPSSRSHKAAVFRQQYAAFLDSQGKVLKKPPVAGGKDLDLSLLYRVVSKRGGFSIVSENKGWKQVASALQLTDKTGNVAFSLRSAYQRHLLQFEQEQSSRSATAPASEADGQLLATSRLVPKSTVRSSRGQSETFRGAKRKLDSDLLEPSAAAGILNELLNHDTLPAEYEEQAELAKSLGVQASDILGSYDHEDETACHHCLGGHHESEIACCDRCERGFHFFCVSPELTDHPTSDWVCPQCLAAEDDPGISPCQTGRCTHLRYQTDALRFHHGFTGGAVAASKVSEADLESAFWRILEDGEEPMQTLSSAAATLPSSAVPRLSQPATDLSQQGYTAPLQSPPKRPRQATFAGPLPKSTSRPAPGGRPPQRGAPRAAPAQSSTDGFTPGAGRDGNGGSRPQTGEHLEPHSSMIQDADVAMDLVPDGSMHGPRALALAAAGDAASAEVGIQLNSAESSDEDGDMRCIASPPPWTLDQLPSMQGSILRWVDPRDDLPGLACAQLEAAYEELMPEAMERRPDLMHCRATMLSPLSLLQAGVPICRVVQKPGEMIALQPGAFYASLSLGYGTSESTCWALADWIPRGRRAARQLAHRHTPTSLCHDHLLLSASHQTEDAQEAAWLQPEVASMQSHDTELRLRLWSKGVRVARRLERKLPAVKMEETPPRRKGQGLHSPTASKFSGRSSSHASLEHPCAWEPFQCSICRASSCLTGLECMSCPGARVVCPSCISYLCECPPSAHRIVFGPSLATLDSLRCRMACLSASATGSNLPKPSAPPPYLLPRLLPSSILSPAADSVPGAIAPPPSSSGDKGRVHQSTVLVGSGTIPHANDAEAAAAATSGSHNLGKPKAPDPNQLPHTYRPRDDPLVGPPVPSAGGPAQMHSRPNADPLIGPSAAPAGGPPPTHSSMDWSPTCSAHPHRDAVEALQHPDEPQWMGQTPQSPLESLPVDNGGMEAASASEGPAPKRQKFMTMTDLVDIDPGPTPSPGPNGVFLGPGAAREAAEAPKRHSFTRIDEAQQGVVPGTQDDGEDGISALMELALQASLQEPGSPGSSGAHGKEYQPADYSVGATSLRQVEEWAQEHCRAWQAWQQKAEVLLACGNCGTAVIEALLGQAGQFAFGTADIDLEAVQRLSSRLTAASTWALKAHSYTQSKPTMEEMQEASAWQPPPVFVPGWDQMTAAYAAAKGWRQHASKATSHMQPIAVGSLEELVSEAAQMPLLIPEADALREKLEAAQQLGGNVRRLLRLEQPADAGGPDPPPAARTGRRKLSATGHPPVDDVTLKSLVAQISQLGVDLPEMKLLEAAVERLEGFQLRARGAAAGKPSRQHLTDLQQEASELPAVVPEIAAIQALADKANAWLASAAACAQAPLKKRREVLHAGQRLAVELPEVEELRAAIRRCEWNEAAKRVLSGSQAPPAVGESQPIASPHPSQVGAALVTDGNLLGVKLDALGLAGTALADVRAWLKQAKLVTAGDAPGPGLVSRGTNALSEGKPSSKGPQDSLQALQQLLQQSQELAVHLPEVEAIAQRTAKAQAWSERAAAVLRQPMSSAQEERLQAMVLDGTRLRLRMPLLSRLEHSLRSWQWHQEARAALLAMAPTPSGSAQRPELASLQHLEKAGRALLASLDSHEPSGMHSGEGHAGYTQQSSPSSHHDDALVGEEMQGRLTKAVQAASAWRAELRAALLRRSGAPEPLEALLDCLIISLDHALRQLHIRLKEEQRRVEQGLPPTPPPLSAPRAEETLRQLRGVVPPPMRGPHSGSGQKHEAVHLPRLQRHKGDPAPLEAAAVRVHQTRCVERQVLASALDAARQLPCRTPEEDSLEHILACFDHWQ
ncbi:hypothetical protein WJX84_002284, partial [Apatococcus fuscideae]